MTNLMSFVVNTGTREGDQYEIARYQQYYHAHGVALAAQPQPHGGFLLTTVQSQQAGGAGQYGNAAQSAYAAPTAQPVDATHTGYGQPPQPYAGAAYGPPPQAYGDAAPAAAPIVPQPLVAVQAAYGPLPEPPGFSTQHGFGTPQQYGCATPGGYGPPPQQPVAAAPPAWAAAPQQPAVAAPPAWAPAPQQPVDPTAAAQAAWAAAPQQPAVAAQAAWAQVPQQPVTAPAAYAAPQQQGGAAPAWASLPQDAGAAPAAYGAGFSAGAPGVAPGGAFGVPAARRSGIGSAFGNLTLLQKLKFAGTGIVVLGLAGWSFFLMRQAQSNIVLFENSLDVPGELSLAGKSYGSIAPRQALRLELDSGNHEVSFTANGTKLDGGTLTVPKGNSTIGYRAVYNIGGKKGLAVVTKYYGGTFEDRVAAVAEGTRVVEVPGAQALDRVDDSFPDTITVPKHQSYGTVVRVCHVDEAKGTVGCPGW